MVHKPKHRVHSFRGLLGDGGEDIIELNKQNNNVAYKIIKFNILSATPSSNIEHLVEIWNESQSSITGTINVTAPDWLASAWESGGGYSRPENFHVMINDAIFSRNIYVTHFEVVGSTSCNYYIELEEVPVSPATLMQLKLGVARKLNLTQ